MVDDGGAHGLVRSLRRDAGQEGGDRLGADDRFECGPDDAATIGGEDGIRIEDAQQPFQISGRRGLGEGVDDTAVHRGIDRESWLAGIDVVASARGQFPTGCGVSAQRRTDLGEREPEQVVQDERRALGRGQRLQDDQHRPRDGVGQADRVGRIGCRLHRLRQPGPT